MMQYFISDHFMFVGMIDLIEETIIVIDLEIQGNDMENQTREIQRIVVQTDMIGEMPTPLEVGSFPQIEVRMEEIKTFQRRKERYQNPEKSVDQIVRRSKQTGKRKTLKRYQRPKRGKKQKKLEKQRRKKGKKKKTKVKLRKAQIRKRKRELKQRRKQERRKN